MKIENEVLIWKRLGRRVTEQLEVLRKRYLSAAEQFQSLTRYPKEAVLIGSILVLTGAIFAFAGSHESAEPKVWNTDETEFKRDRILGDPYAVTVKAKEDLLGKVTKDYQSSQKDVLEGLSAVKTRLEALEAKAVGLQPGQGMTEPKELLEEPSSPMPGGIGISDEADPVPLAQQGSAPGGESHVGRNAPQEPRPRRLRAAHLAARLPLTPPVGPEILAFPVPGGKNLGLSEVVLPVGSYVKAKLLTGVEAPEGNPYPVLMQLDFAYILPNKKSLDLRGCFVIAKAQGDLSTERVQMQATKLSCVGRSGQMFERDINGFVTDAVDNSFAVIGAVNSKQDRVAAMAFLSSVVEGVGRAIQMAQMSEDTSAAGATKRSMTGDEGRYITAGGAGQAAGMVAQWYLKQAQNLLPTINVGSGQDVWIVMQESAELPQHYFRKLEAGEKSAKDFSFVRRLFD